MSGERNRRKNLYFYNVKILPEQNETPLPSSIVKVLRRHASLISENNHTKETASNFIPNFILRNLSQISPISMLAWKTVWPQHIQSRIISCIHQHDIFDGLRSSLEICKENKRSESTINEKDPLSFSYWISSNLPLSESQRLELLSTSCLSQRLRTIFQWMEAMVKEDLEKKKETNSLYCDTCGQDICWVKDSFTVQGADGISGSYVNEHGVVHQTITVRKVKLGNIFLEGEPETRDSWFPGYSWTIMYCGSCENHLGWRFLRVGASQELSHSSNNNVDHNMDHNGQVDEFWG